MSSSLKDNLSSDYIDAFGYLLSKAKPDPVYVYVESEEDISFWRNVLHQFETDRIAFQINLPSVTLAKGKKVALERNADIIERIQKENVGSKLIVCVDSDYDYLLPEYREEGRLINESSYIFQTYSYSIENLKCYAESLHTICCAATFNDTKLVDLVEFLKVYSTVVYDLFIWNLYLYSQQDFETFPISEFCKIIHLNNFSPEDLGEATLLDLKSKVDVKLQELNILFVNKSSELDKLKGLVSVKGLIDESTYLFLKGHTVFDDVVIPVIKALCKQLSQKHRTFIKESGQTPTLISNNLNQYENNMKVHKIESLLSNNTEFKKCFLYQKLHADLDRYVASLNP